MPPAAVRGSAVDIVVVRGCWWCKINDSGGKKGRQREREKGRGYGMGEGKRERLRARVCVCLEEVEKVQQREREREREREGGREGKKRGVCVWFVRVHLFAF